MQLSSLYISADVLHSLVSVTCCRLSLPISKMGIRVKVRVKKGNL